VNKPISEAPSGLSALFASVAPKGEGFRIEAPDDWTQGRTLYGGLTAALSFHAVKLANPDLPPFRSGQFCFISPATGVVDLFPSILRQGRGATVANVDVFAQERLAARVLLTYGAGLESRIVHDYLPMPKISPPTFCDLFVWNGPRPLFLRNFELRFASGAPPISQGSKPEFFVWVRPLHSTDVDPSAILLAVADTLPPAATVSFETAAMISTMTWTLDVAQPVLPSEWYLLRSSSEQASSGYSRQAMHCWDLDGRCISIGRQTVALFD
jgi:acyl-CoA thioesterase